jgi:hypothetical protein
MEGCKMKILSEKKSICTIIKVLYAFGENYYQDIEDRKKDGWKVVAVYDKEYGWSDLAIKRSSNGNVLTFKKYEPID